VGKEREIGPNGKPEMREALTTAAIVSSADTLTHSPVYVLIHGMFCHKW